MRFAATKPWGQIVQLVRGFWLGTEQKRAISTEAKCLVGPLVSRVVPLIRRPNNRLARVLRDPVTIFEHKCATVNRTRHGILANARGLTLFDARAMGARQD